MQFSHDFIRSSSFFRFKWLNHLSYSTNTSIDQTVARSTYTFFVVDRNRNKKRHITRTNISLYESNCFITPSPSAIPSTYTWYEVYEKNTAFLYLFKHHIYTFCRWYCTMQERHIRWIYRAPAWLCSQLVAGIIAHRFDSVLKTSFRSCYVCCSCCSRCWLASSVAHVHSKIFFMCCESI